MTSPRPLGKKQVVELIARGESLGAYDMRGLDLAGVCFDGTDLKEAKLGDANLARCTFRGADMRWASLWHADCKDAVFDEAILEEADLDYSNLDGCSFHGARIKKAIFPLAKLPLELIQDSVRTGRKVKMERTQLNDD